MTSGRAGAGTEARSTPPGHVPKLKDLHCRLVARCPLRCSHCYASAWFARSDRLPSRLVSDTIDQAIELGLERVTFTGGEPLLHPHLAALLEHCLARGVRAKIETSGLLLCSTAAAIRQLIVDSKRMISVCISYDLAPQRGLSEEQHDRIRNLIADLHERGVDVRLQTTVTEINVGDLEKLTEFAQNLGIRQRIFLDHSVLGSGASMAPLALDVVLSTYQYLKSQRLDLDLELPPLISGELQEGCGWALDRCEIMPNGDVTACGPITFTHTEFVAGNIRSESLRALWCEREYFRAMRQLERADFGGVCGRCTFWQDCRGSCRAYAWSRGQNWFSPYPLCEIFATRYPEETRTRAGGSEEGQT